MKTSIQIFLPLACAFLSACSTKTVFVPSVQTAEAAELEAKLGVISPSDSYIIQDVSIDANFLFVTVQYQASCSGKDKIELIGSEQLVSATVPIRQVKLVIQANDEDCHELQSRTLTFRIHALSGMKVRDFTTDLHISGYRTKMRYVYV